MLPRHPFQNMPRSGVMATETVPRSNMTATGVRSASGEGTSASGKVSANPQPRPTVALFATCLVELLRPRIAVAAAALIEAAECDVVLPKGQTCCGQPAYNAGDRSSAAALARRTIRLLEPYDAVVVPSGSCAGMIARHYPALFDEGSAWRRRADAVAARTWELTGFLAARRPDLATGARFEGLCAYHDSCSCLRDMGVRDAPRTLLARVAGLEIADLPGAQVCCGFGGTFAVDYADISDRLAIDKCREILETGADIVAAADLGCLLQLAGKFHRANVPIGLYHVAEVLAGIDGPPIGGPLEDDTEMTVEQPPAAGR